MAKEIEHKYLIISECYKELSENTLFIKQGYLSKDPERVVRIRIIDTQAYITIKSKNKGDTRNEFEYPIPVSEAEEMLKMCIGEPIMKRRWIVNYKGYKWEVDEFINKNSPTIAEIELKESGREYPLPPFIGAEVTGKKEYYNSNI
ncbi:MAG: CYTH domain-containing protein [Muribaculaceae bacterium]|nr:CYTH domain-containing protein [Muribaculaceae bacterium]